MNDERIRAAYEHGLPQDDGTTSLDDVSAERLRRLVEREGSETERLRTLDLALSSAAGRRELEIAWSAARAARPRARRWRGYAAAACLIAAAGGIVAHERIVGSPNANSTSHTTLRGADSPINLVGPVGRVAPGRAAHFAWHAVGGVERYTLVVVDTTGTEIFATETRDSSLALPDSVRLIPGRDYLWWVQARLMDQSTITAVTQRFSVAPK